MYSQAGPQFLEELNRHHLPTPMVIVLHICVGYVPIKIDLNEFCTVNIKNNRWSEMYLKCSLYDVGCS